MEREQLQSFRKRRVRVIGPDENVSVRSSVHCAVRGEGQSIEGCRGCPRLTQETSESLTCCTPESSVTPKEVCGEIIPKNTLALDVELGVTRAHEILEKEGLLLAPVVDDNAQLLGVVSVIDLSRLTNEPDAEVEDIVQATVAVNEHLGVAALAKVMDEQGLERVPVVNDEGCLLGVVTALDVMRWLSKRSRTNS